MTAAVMSQHDDFRAAFKRELDAVVEKLERPVRGEKKDPARLKKLRSAAESMAENIGRRMIAYSEAFDLDALAAEPKASCTLPASNHPTSNAMPRSRLEDLEAELRVRAAEEDRLRSELVERKKAVVEEGLRQSNVDLLRARQAVLSSEQVIDSQAAEMKSEQLQRQLNQIEKLVAATGSLASAVDQDRENNRRIEEQRSRGVHYTEAELLAPVGHHDTHGSAGMEWEDHETQRLSADLERSQKFCRRMQQQFHESP